LPFAVSSRAGAVNEGEVLLLEQVDTGSSRPQLAIAQALPVASAEPYPDEIRRWTVLLGLPMLGACLFIALAIGTSLTWLYGGAVLLGPGVGIGAIVYLAMSSDTNGRAYVAADSPRRHTNNHANPRSGR
jgi:hypothetical protein